MPSKEWQAIHSVQVQCDHLVPVCWLVFLACRWQSIMSRPRTSDAFISSVMNNWQGTRDTILSAPSSFVLHIYTMFAVSWCNSLTHTHAHFTCSMLCVAAASTPAPYSPRRESLSNTLIVWRAYRRDSSSIVAIIKKCAITLHITSTSVRISKK